MRGGKPKVFRLIISDPLHQILYFSANNMMLPYSLDFVLFFTINFDEWCFIVQSIALVASEKTNVENIVKSE